jgi:hypothetical protein
MTFAIYSKGIGRSGVTSGLTGSGQISVSSTTTLGDKVIDPPTGLFVDSFTTVTITLDWNDHPAGDFDYFEVLRSDDDIAFSVIATGLTNSIHMDSGLTVGTKYYYKVRAYDTGGGFGETASIEQNTAMNAPAAPTFGTLGDSSIEIVLPTSTMSVHVSFMIERSTDGVNYSDIATGVTAATYNDTGLPQGFTYYYRVLDEDDQDNLSPPSPSISHVLPITDWQPLSNPDYWVAPTSQGSGDGLSRDNAMTLASLPTLQPGDIVTMRSDLGPYIDPGFFFSGINGTAADMIYIQGESAVTHAVIKGAFTEDVIYGIRLTDCSYFDIAGVDMDGFPTAAGKTRHPYYTIRTPLLLDGDTHHCVLHHFDWRRSVGWSGINIEGTSHHNVIRDFTGGEHGTRDVWTNDDYGVGQGTYNDDVGDYLQTGTNTYQNLFLRGSVYAIGHGSTNIAGTYNAVLETSINGDFLDDLHPDPWPTWHPYYGVERVRTLLPGKQKGTRNGTTRGNYQFYGRNLIQNCDFYNARNQQDNNAKGQVWRLAGYRNIFRYNLVRDVDCTSGISATASSQTDRQSAENQIYNNDFQNQTRETDEVDYPIEIRGVAGTAAGSNRVFNNAFGATFDGTVALIDHRDYANDPYPHYYDQPSDVWGNNKYYHNSHAAALSALSLNGATTDGNLWWRPLLDWQGDRPTECYGNIGGTYKSSNGGAPHAKITSGTGVGNTFQVDDPLNFVYGFDSEYIPNDTLYINGVRTQIVSVNESTRMVTVEDSVSWTTNDGIYVSETVDASGNVTTGRPS